ncbi:MAG: type II secretion system protein [Candidatus Omnitrophica bacterium]|nr:type II secretion system protein [Candidatus Omnitrophota bacterium]
MPPKKAFTLIELLVVMMLVGVLCVIIFSLGNLFFRYINADAERYNIYSQMDYTLEDMRLRCASAVRLDNVSAFSPSIEQTKSEFGFFGESDIYNVTADDLDDNVWYKYTTDPLNRDFILETIVNGSVVANEVLIEGRYQPNVEFTYIPMDEPNFLSVTVNAVSEKAAAGLPKNISKTENISFWFVDIVQ